MPYRGGKVNELFGPLAQAATDRCAERMCDRAGDELLDEAVRNTPVKTGRLRRAWRRDPTAPAGTYYGSPRYRTTVTNPTDYAPFVENGTGLWGPEHRKYEIRPKKPGGYLRWVGEDGQVHFAKVVHHPGSPGNHMLAIALNVTESLADDGAIFEPALAEWGATLERGGDR